MQVLELYLLGNGFLKHEGIPGGWVISKVSPEFGNLCPRNLSPGICPRNYVVPGIMSELVTAELPGITRN